MSRIANNPVAIPNGVEVFLDGQALRIKGAKGELTMQVHNLVSIDADEGFLSFKANEESKNARALAGTFRSLVNNMVHGVSEGFQKELELQGVGYRAQAQGKKLNLSLGFSHPVEYQAPEGIDFSNLTSGRTTHMVFQNIHQRTASDAWTDEKNAYRDMKSLWTGATIFFPRLIS